ncbi:MAG: cupin domain-containing protein [Chloroflexia bacterium]|nr:cupin domain-containing protein [Chloroflexia bacterium]
MQAFEFDEIIRAQREQGTPYLQFLSEETLSLGVYVLEAGATDTQSPHTEDEVYYVVQGRGMVEVAGERRSVQSGSMIFVAKDVDHRFVDITEDLSLLVFFAPEHRG